MIKKMVKEKVENHKRKRITTCNKNALEEALEVADSLMIKTALSQVDTSNQVNRPAKPSRPDINLPVDTTPIKPLFKETIIPTLDTSSLVQKPKLINKDSLLNKSILHYKN